MKQNKHNAAAFAVVKALKRDPEAVAASISSFISLIGRGDFVQRKAS
jgi:UDP-N-acetylmuramoylalanine-D-glutamate ligase